MNKQDILNDYPKQEDKLFISKFIDKIESCKQKNKIVNTDFLGIYERSLAEKILEKVEVNTVFYGGFDGAERTILIIYPDKITPEILENIYNKLLSIVRISLPNDLHGKYVHKNYLGAVMKLGIKREKIGDIRVRDDGADIIVCSEMAEYISDKLKELTRFNKATVEFLDISEIKYASIQKQELTIIIPSMRLDCAVGEMIRMSRTKANEIILSGRVFINGENILKNSKSIDVGDVITVRGKGRFEIAEVQGTTKKGRIVLRVYKYM